MGERTNLTLDDEQEKLLNGILNDIGTLEEHAEIVAKLAKRIAQDKRRLRMLIGYDKIKFELRG